MRLYDSAVLGQLLQGAAAARPARHPLRAGRGRHAHEGRQQAECSAARTRRCACRCSSSTTAATSPESNAILWYLADGTPTCSTDPFDRAQVLQWMFFEQYEPRAVHRGRPPPDDARPRRRLPPTPTQRRERGYGALEAMEQHLARARVLRRRALLDRRHLALRLHARRRTKAASISPLSGDQRVARRASPPSPATSRSTTRTRRARAARRLSCSSPQAGQPAKWARNPGSARLGISCLPARARRRRGDARSTRRSRPLLRPGPAGGRAGSRARRSSGVVLRDPCPQLAACIVQRLVERAARRSESLRRRRLPRRTSYPASAAISVASGSGNPAAARCVAPHDDRSARRRIPASRLVFSPPAGSAIPTLIFGESYAISSAWRWIR